jgi:uncharacterized membrane protein YheB (UPF0754 family)
MTSAYKILMVDSFWILIVLIPFISALIGWMTNYIAIRSLFRPLKMHKFGIFSIHGLIPKRKKAIARNIASVVEEYLFNHNDIFAELEKPSNIKKIKKKILPILLERILERIPSMFKSFAEPLIEGVLEKEFDKIILNISSEISNHAFETIDIKGIIEKKILDYDTIELEKMVYKVGKKELRHIEMLGAVIGFLIGCFQVFLMLLLG